MRVKFTIDTNNSIVILSSDNEEIFVNVVQDGDQKIVLVSSPEQSTDIHEENT